MVELISVIVAVGFFFNALLHLLLILGYPLGEYVLGGKYVILPPNMRIISVIFLLIWTLIGISYLNYGHIIQIAALKGYDRSAIILATIFLFFAFFSNAFLTTSKKERYLMVPFCFITFFLSSILLFL